AIGPRANLYATELDTYLKNHQFDTSVKDMEIAAIKEGKFPHSAYLSHLTITGIETVTNTALTSGGALLSNLNATSGSLVQFTGPTIVSGIGNLSHQAVDYTSGYKQYSNKQELAKKYNILSVADNTFATPTLQQPLTFGFDVV
ncbi:unnamed protein product, partial [marine sediment metagenome]